MITAWSTSIESSRSSTHRRGCCQHPRCRCIPSSGRSLGSHAEHASRAGLELCVGYIRSRPHLRIHARSHRQFSAKVGEAESRSIATAPRPWLIYSLWCSIAHDSVQVLCKLLMPLDVEVKGTGSTQGEEERAVLSADFLCL
jgi:hypothetical protein